MNVASHAGEFIINSREHQLVAHGLFAPNEQLLSREGLARPKRGLQSGEPVRDGPIAIYARRSARPR